MAIERVQWNFFANGWQTDQTGQVSFSDNRPGNNITAIGPEKGYKDNPRTCIAITLSNLSEYKKRDKLEVVLSLINQYFYSSDGNQYQYDNFIVQCYTQPPSNKGDYLNPRGEEISTTKQRIDVGPEGTKFKASFDIDISSLNKEEQTIYLYITTQTAKFLHVYHFRDGSSFTEKTGVDFTDITIGQIDNSSKIYTPTETIEVSWSGFQNGQNNNINGYDFYLYYGDINHTPANSEYILKESLASNINKYQIDIAKYGIQRAQKVWVGIVAKGSRKNTAIKTKAVGIINSLPGAPTVSSSGNIVNTTVGSSIVYNITRGGDSNANETLRVYYSINNGERKIVIDEDKREQTLTIDISTNDIINGTNTITFWTYDQREYSSPTVLTFTAIFKPVINNSSTTVTFTEVPNISNGTNSNLTSAVKIAISMSSGTPKTVKVYVRAGEAVSLDNAAEFLLSNNYFTYNEGTKTININKISEISDIDPGSYYQIAFKVNDGTTDSDLSNWSTVKRRPFMPKCPTYNSYNCHVGKQNANAKENYYKEKVTINYSNITSGEGYAKISSLAVVASYGDSIKEYPCDYNSNTSSIELILKEVNVNTKTVFSFKITDQAGQTSIANLFSLTKSSSLVFSGNLTNVSNQSLKPLTSNLDFRISHPIANATGTDTFLYKYYIKIGNKTEEISYNPQNSTTASSTITTTITAEEINNKAKLVAPNQADKFNASIIIEAIDGFDDKINLSTSSFIVNFIEPPSFIDNTIFTIKHDFYTSTTTIDKDTGIKVTNSDNKEGLHASMINSGEGIIFVLPKAKDPNNDIKEYQIYLARNDFIDKNKILKPDAVEYNNLLISIPYETLKNGPQDTSENGYYYYRYTASTYTKNEYFYFKTRVVDNLGNVSQDKICSNYLIGCRTMAPVFSVDNIKVSRNNRDVTLDYNFTITDLGGSATKNGWNKTFYENYPNFDRLFAGYTPKAILTIEIAPNQEFHDGEKISETISFTPSSNQTQADFTNNHCYFSEFGTERDYPKIFIRFTLEVSFSLKNNSGDLAFISSTPQIHTYFGSVPTVAHRVHKVGINTTSLGPDDVLVVENYSGTKYLRFKGTDPSNASKTYEITIDLLTGSISGALIDCGTW